MALCFSRFRVLTCVIPSNSFIAISRSPQGQKGQPWSSDGIKKVPLLPRAGSQKADVTDSPHCWVLPLCHEAESRCSSPIPACARLCREARLAPALAAVSLAPALAAVSLPPSSAHPNILQPQHQRSSHFPWVRAWPVRVGLILRCLVLAELGGNVRRCYGSFSSL